MSHLLFIKCRSPFSERPCGPPSHWGAVTLVSCIYNLRPLPTLTLTVNVAEGSFAYFFFWYRKQARYNIINRPYLYRMKYTLHGTCPLVNLHRAWPHKFMKIEPEPLTRPHCKMRTVFEHGTSKKKPVFSVRTLFQKNTLYTH